MIVLDDIWMRYASSETPRLAGINAHLDEGELCLVLGPTGSGKSTLLGCINNLVPRFTGGIRSGRVEIGGVETTHEFPRDLAERVGFVGQDPLAGFVTDTVEEELAYAMEQLGVAPQEMRRRVEETLDLLGIADLRRRALRTLSGGQQQRVAIGSVLTAGPSVLVLDEPTSALDPVAAEEVLSLVSRLVRDLGTTVVMAEHRMERVAEFADTALLLHSDATATHGPVRDVLAASPIRPPVAELGLQMGWQPLPLGVREARRHALPQRQQWAATPPSLPPASTPGETLVSARGVVVRHREVLAVRDVDLDLHAGQVTALMGRNGSGKSSLLWALHSPGRRDHGRVKVTGGIALVPQTAADLLYLDSVAAECKASDDLAGLTPGTTAQLLEGLAGNIEPGSHPRDLSAGQQLALVLAAELARAPRVVLLDEPTRGLDYAAKASLTRTVRKLAADGHAVVLATHDVELVAESCDRVLMMAEGEVVSDGPTRDVLPGSALLGTQTSKVAHPVPLLTVEEFVRAAG